MPQCQVEGCEREARWSLFELKPDGGKVWMDVCDMHEYSIGNKNMLLQGYNPYNHRKIGARRARELLSNESG